MIFLAQSLFIDLFLYNLSICNNPLLKYQDGLILMHHFINNSMDFQLNYIYFRYTLL